jgi:predicted PurR-regulated permease PerM
MPEKPAEQASPSTVAPDQPARPEPAASPLAPVMSRTYYLRLATRWALVVLALYTIGWLIVQAQSALTPFILGLVLAYLLLPIVNRLNKLMPRWLAILLVYIVFGSIGGAAIAFIVPAVAEQIRQLISSIPSITQLEQMGADLLQRYRASVPADLRAPIDEAVTSALSAVQTNISAYAQSLGGFLVGRVLQIVNTVVYLIGLLIIPIWLFFVLNDQAKGSAAITQLLHPRARSDFWSVWSIINAVLSNYVRGQLILGLAVGIGAGLGLTALGFFGFPIPYVLTLSIIAGITELIPIIGPIIGSIPAVLIAFSISPAAGVAVLILYIVIQQVENNFLVPRIVGESIGIHPALLSVLLLAMGQVFGILGVILSAPVAAISRDLFVYTYQRLSGATPHQARAAVHEYARNEEPIPEALKR